VSVEQVRPALAARGDRPLCILDIALPRDVDPAVGELGNVFLYNLDDLQAVVSSNIERRRAEIPTAEELISAEAARYWDWLAGLAAVPVLTEMRSRADAVRARELAEALRRLPNLSDADRAIVEELSRSLMNKFLHEPTVRLRAAAANGRGLGAVDAVRYLFGLEGEKPETEAADPTTSQPSGGPRA
jgi:glutamyl-tRNA reductase